MIKCYLGSEVRTVDALGDRVLREQPFCIMQLMAESPVMSTTSIRSEQTAFRRSCKELSWAGASIAINILHRVTPSLISKPHSGHTINRSGFSIAVSLF